MAQSPPRSPPGGWGSPPLTLPKVPVIMTASPSPLSPPQQQMPADFTALLLGLPPVPMSPTPVPVEVPPAGLPIQPVPTIPIQPFTPAQIQQPALVLPAGLPIQTLPQFPTATELGIPTTPVIEKYPQMWLDQARETYSRRDELNAFESQENNTRAYLDLMKTIYPDRTLLRDILLKYRTFLKTLIRFRDRYSRSDNGDPFRFQTYRFHGERFDELTKNLTKLLEQPSEISDLDINYIMYGLISLGEILKKHEYQRTRYPPTAESPSEERVRKETVQRTEQFWNMFQIDLTDLGYEFHYFDFFKSGHPLVRVFWDQIPPTPETFEGMTLSLSQGMYEGVVDTITNNWTIDTTLSDVSKWLGPYPRLVGWRKQDLAKAIKATGLNDSIVVPDPRSEEYGVKLDKYKKAKVRYERTDDYDDYVKKDRALEKLWGYPSTLSPEGRYTSKLKEMFGRTAGSGPRRHFVHNTGALLPGEDIKRGAMIGLDEIKEGSYLYRQGQRGINSYLPKYYYEAIYRKLFNTMVNVDWAQVCQQNLVEYPKLQRIAVTEFNFDQTVITRLDYNEICGLLEEESKRRRAIREELTIGIPEAQAAVAFQPGGRLMMGAMKEAIARQPEMFAPVAEPEKEVKPELRRLIDMCADPEVTRDHIFALAQEMDLEILFARLPQAAPTKEDYCRVLQNYLRQIGR